jgi:hypothetical protein
VQLLFRHLDALVQQMRVFLHEGDINSREEELFELLILGSHLRERVSGAVRNSSAHSILYLLIVLYVLRLLNVYIQKSYSTYAIYLFAPNIHSALLFFWSNGHSMHVFHMPIQSKMMQILCSYANRLSLEGCLQLIEAQSMPYEQMGVFLEES